MSIDNVPQPIARNARPRASPGAKRRNSKSDPDMTLDVNNSGGGGGGVPQNLPARAKERPEWADGLRKLYDSVVEEPLPDSFRELLDRLDKKP